MARTRGENKRHSRFGRAPGSAKAVRLRGGGVRRRLAGLCGLSALSLASSPAPAQDREAFTLVVLGDSLTAGFGLDDPRTLEKGLEAALAEAGLAHVDVVSAGVSGDTAAGARGRFDWSVGTEADGVLIEVGANDMFSGRAPEAIKDDIAWMIARARDRGLWTGIIGMRAPRNAGADYRRDFDGLYPDLADETCAVLYPFYFKGLIDPETGAQDEDLFLADGIHPNAQGAAEVAARMGRWLGDALMKPACGDGAG